jgi:hypothetical protein
MHSYVSPARIPTRCALLSAVAAEYNDNMLLTLLLLSKGFGFRPTHSVVTDIPNPYKGRIMNAFRLLCIIFAFSTICFVQPVHSQSPEKDTSFRPYHVNYWVSGPLLGVGAASNYLGISRIMNKDEISRLEIQALNKDVLNGVDKWALRQDPFKRESYDNYAEITIVSSVLLPVVLLSEKQIRRDWVDVCMIYLETMSFTSFVYEWSFLGTSFIDRFRPVTYYDQLPYEERSSGKYRNSFYSGHVASAAAATFFMVKVFSDYNPGIGDNKYILYGAATIPPLVLGYFRVKGLKHFPSDVMVGLAVGALCGILIPELHRVSIKNTSLGVYSSFEGTGLSLSWQPHFGK